MKKHAVGYILSNRRICTKICYRTGLPRRLPAPRNDGGRAFKLFTMTGRGILQILITTIMFIFASQIFAIEGYFDIHEKGWHWYDDPQTTIQTEEQEDPVAKMDALKSTISKALSRAILHPTEENIRDYMLLQKFVSDKSTTFANNWQKVLLTNPELNYALVHPTNNLAKQVDLDQLRKKEDEAIADLAKSSGLFFFYRSSCVYCQKFAPILKNFSERYGIEVIAITLDGKSLPEFEHSEKDKGQAARFKVKIEPALFAVNPRTRLVYPVSYGVISEEDLRRRILDIHSMEFNGGGL